MRMVASCFGLASAVLVVCSGSPLVCQTPGQAPAEPGQSGNNAPSIVLSQKTLRMGPPAGQTTLGQPLKMPLPLGAGSVRLGSAQIDPEMIVHPPQTSIGMQPPGTQVAQNLYPGLELMPIDRSKAKVEPIPTMISNVKMEKIPTTWTQFTVSPIQSGKPTPATK